MIRQAIIVAGGTGTRMQSELPKQFLKLGGVPILVRTVQMFLSLRPEVEIILVLPESQMEYWKEISARYDIGNIAVTNGGNTRTASVRNGIANLSQKESIIAIHDGVRPLASAALINKIYDEAEENGNAVAAIKLKDSLRKVNGNNSEAKDRAAYRLIQTPQAFKSSDLRQAYESSEISDATDDANIMEKRGMVIHLVDGEENNIKITDRSDLAIAEALLAQMAKKDFTH